MKIKKILSISTVIAILLSFSLSSNAAFEPIIDSIGSSSEDGKDGTPGSGSDISQGTTSTYEESDALLGTSSVVNLTMSTAPKANFLIDRNAVTDGIEMNDLWRDWNANGTIEYGDLTDSNNDGVIGIEDLLELFVDLGEDGYFDLSLLDAGADNIKTIGEMIDSNKNGRIEMIEVPKSLTSMNDINLIKQAKFVIKTSVVGELGQPYNKDFCKYGPYSVKISLSVKEWLSPNGNNISEPIFQAESILDTFGADIINELSVTCPTVKAGHYSGKFEVKIELIENTYVGYEYRAE